MPGKGLRDTTRSQSEIVADLISGSVIRRDTTRSYSQGFDGHLVSPKTRGPIRSLLTISIEPLSIEARLAARSNRGSEYPERI